MLMTLYSRRAEFLFVMIYITTVAILFDKQRNRESVMWLQCVCFVEACLHYKHQARNVIAPVGAITAALSAYMRSIPMRGLVTLWAHCM